MSDVKKVKMDVEQYRLLRNCFRGHRQMGRILAAMTVSLLDEIEQRENDNWDSVAKILGFSSFYEAQDAGWHFNINWLERCVTATPTDALGDSESR